MKPTTIMTAIAIALVASAATAQRIDTDVYFAYHQARSATAPTIALSRRPCSDAAAAKQKWLKAASFQRDYYGIMEETDACWKEGKHAAPYGAVADLSVCIVDEKRLTSMCEPANYDAFRKTSSLPARANF